MAQKISDFSLNSGLYNKMDEVFDANAFVLAVRTIILSKPGNFPLTPSLGMDIEKYLFDIADEYTLNSIKTELTSQIAKYISNSSNVNVEVELLEDYDKSTGELKNIIGISVSAIVANEEVVTNFLLYKDHELLNIYNETY